LEAFQQQIQLINKEFQAIEDFNQLPKSSLDKLETLVEELNKKYLNMVALFQAEEKKNKELQ